MVISEKIKETMKLYSPTILHYTGMGMMMTVAHNINNGRMKALLAMYEVMDREYERYLRMVTPNNRLKREGKPMKRKPYYIRKHRRRA